MNTKIEIIWEDIESLNNSWNDKEYAILHHQTKCIVTSIGYLIEDNREYVIITDSICDKLGLIGNTTKILHANVIQINELQYIK